MVVREQTVDVADHSMASQYLSISAHSEEEEEEEDSRSSSSSSDPNRTSVSAPQRKRKVSEADEEREMKRQKNREAAKRCRDKKQRQTEDLKRTNGDLEKENCQLSKQRDELIRKCKEYQREIEQHRHHGCALPQFNPPYNLDQLLQPASPPSPTSFSESAPSTSSCPSPASSVSPGPSTRHPHSAHSDASHDGICTGDANSHAKDVVRGPSPRMPVPTSAAGMGQVVLPESNRLHYLRVRRKDGSYKILCLDHDNYLKVMHNLKAHRAAAAVKTSHCESTPVQTAVSTVAQDSYAQRLPFQHEEETNNHVNTGMMQLLPQMEDQEENNKSEPNLDTTEDLISILKSHVKDTGNGFELKPVSEDEVSIKQEPMDTDYEQTSFLNPQADQQFRLMGIKQENKMRDMLRPWSSTGRHIRTGLEVLTNQDDPSCHIQNIVQFLERDEQIVPCTVAGANTDQQLVQIPRQNVTSQLPSPRSRETVSYVTSSAPVTTLSKTNVGTNLASHVLQQATKQQVSCQADVQQLNGVQSISTQHQNMVFSPMQTIKLRPSTASLVTSSSITVQGGPEAPSLVTSSALNTHQTGQETATLTAFQSSTSSSITAAARVQPATSFNARSVKTSPGSSHIMTTMPGPQLAVSQALQQNPATPFHHCATSTIDSSAIASLLPQTTASSDNLLSESSSLIAEYLKKNSIETMGL